LINQHIDGYSLTLLLRPTPPPFPYASPHRPSTRPTARCKGAGAVCTNASVWDCKVLLRPHAARAPARAIPGLPSATLCPTTQWLQRPQRARCRAGSWTAPTASRATAWTWAGYACRPPSTSEPRPGFASRASFPLFCTAFENDFARLLRMTFEKSFLSIVTERRLSQVRGGRVPPARDHPRGAPRALARPPCPPLLQLFSERLPQSAPPAVSLTTAMSPRACRTSCRVPCSNAVPSRPYLSFEPSDGPAAAGFAVVAVLALRARGDAAGERCVSPPHGRHLGRLAPLRHLPPERPGRRLHRSPAQAHQRSCAAPCTCVVAICGFNLCLQSARLQPLGLQLGRREGAGTGALRPVLGMGAQGGRSGSWCSCTWSRGCSRVPTRSRGPRGC